MQFHPEFALQHGYCNFFLLPNLTHYQSSNSYIIEMKYLPKKDFAEKSEQQWNDAVKQINAYAIAPRVEILRQGTKLHKIVMQFAGWNMMNMEEFQIKKHYNKRSENRIISSKCPEV